MLKMTNLNYELNSLGVILILVIALILFLSTIFFYLFFKKKSKNKPSKDKNIDQKNIELKEQLEEAIDKYLQKSIEFNNTTREELKEILLLDVDTFYKEDFIKRSNKWKEKNDKEIKKIASNILVESMEKVVSEIMPKFSYNLSIEENKIGRIIGKEGKTIKALEKITGASFSLQKEKENNNILVSSFNPIRRQIAYRTLKSLLENKIIDIPKLEKTYEIEYEKMNLETFEIGKKVVELKLKLTDYIPKEMYSYIGRLKFRTSYSQNIIIHLLECADVASFIAKDLGLNEEKAKLCAFMHDIGKSTDFEEGNDHVESGLIIAKKFNMPNFVINAIESHHGKVPSDNIYSSIAKIADIISASRPGVRIDNKEEVIERSSKIESICNSITGVKKTFVYRSGSEVHVIVNPEIISETKMDLLARKIEEKISNESVVSTRSIDIVLKRENTHQFKTKAKKIN